jgi:hypothetical protein
MQLQLKELQQKSIPELAAPSQRRFNFGCTFNVASTSAAPLNVASTSAAPLNVASTSGRILQRRFNFGTSQRRFNWLHLNVQQEGAPTTNVLNL